MSSATLADYCLALHEQLGAVGAGWAQVYAEQSSTVRLESDCRGHRQVLAEHDGGVGITVRSGHRWLYQAAPWSEQDSLFDWIGARFAVPARTPAIPQSRLLVDISELSDDAGQPIVTTTPPTEVRSAHLVREHILRRRAVVDSAGTLRQWEVRGVRRRAEATVTGRTGTARGFSHSYAGRPGDESEDWQILTAAIQQASRLASASRIGARRTPVLFSQGTGAGLFHELVGHRLETDNLRRLPDGSTLEGRITGCPLTIDDDPTFDGGYGSIPFDDDGQPVPPIRLVTDGEVTGQLGSLRYAEGSNRGRRQDYRRPTLPRATNLVVRPGETKLSELSGPTADGLLIVSSLGAAEVNAARDTFAFHAVEGRYLRPNGESEVVRDAVLHGSVAPVLEAIEAVGDGPLQVDHGSCRKQGQTVPVGLIAPPVRCGMLDWAS